MNSTSGSLKKIAVTIAGPVLILTGIALLVLPGPGLLLIGAGLAVLGTEYHWARRLLAPVKRRLAEAKAKAEARKRDKSQ